jgi:hypothetical protein
MLDFKNYYKQLQENPNQIHFDIILRNIDGDFLNGEITQDTYKTYKTLLKENFIHLYNANLLGKIWENKN